MLESICDNDLLQAGLVPLPTSSLLMSHFLFKVPVLYLQKIILRLQEYHDQANHYKLLHQSKQNTDGFLSNYKMNYIHSQQRSDYRAAKHTTQTEKL